LGTEITKIINPHLINADRGPRLLKADSIFFFTDPNFRVELDMNMDMDINMNMNMDLDINMDMDMDVNVNMNMNHSCIKS
jgi:hypothetical protein